MDTDWTISAIEDLDGKALRRIAANQPELLIIGTGETQQFTHPRIFVPLMDAGIGYEVMDNTAACRTFNILLGEGRNAALALLSDSE